MTLWFGSLRNKSPSVFGNCLIDMSIGEPHKSKSGRRGMGHVMTYVLDETKRHMSRQGKIQHGPSSKPIYKL